MNWDEGPTGISASPNCWLSTLAITRQLPGQCSKNSLNTDSSMSGSSSKFAGLRPLLSGKIQNRLPEPFSFGLVHVQPAPGR